MSLKSKKAKPLHLPLSSNVAILILVISPQCLKWSLNMSWVVSNERLPTNKILEGGFLDTALVIDSFAGLPS